MPKIIHNGVEYDVSEQELTEIEKGFGQEVPNTSVIIWDNDGKELSIITGKGLIDRIIDGKNKRCPVCHKDTLHLDKGEYGMCIFKCKCGYEFEFKEKFLKE